jgi:hypothetical protein
MGRQPMHRSFSDFGTLDSIMANDANKAAAFQRLLPLPDCTTP